MKRLVPTVALCAGLTLFGVGGAHGDIWKCADKKDGSEVFTNNPTGYAQCQHHQLAFPPEPVSRQADRPDGGSSGSSSSIADPPDADSGTEAKDRGPLAVFPPDLVSNLEQLAGLLQQHLADGRLSEARIEQELQQGDLASVIKSLGPEASRLFEDIRTSLKASQSEESLMTLPALLMQHLPQRPVGRP